MEKYGTTLSSHVTLTVPNNVVWEVRLINDKSEILLDKDFIEFYSIGYGHVFRFKYKGNSDFNLIIFDMTASEINYPPPRRPQTEDVPQTSEEQSVEILRVTPSCNKRKFSRRAVTRSMHKSLGKEIEVHQKSIKEDDDETKTAIERAKNLNTNNPLTVVTVHSTYNASMAIISKGFVEEHMVGSDGQMIKELTLEIASTNEGRTKQRKVKKEIIEQNQQWKVKCHHKEKKEIIINWRKFVKENHVKLGDVCAFELVEGGDIDVKVFLVHIFRVGV
ncbi:B3 domain-containing transcription factor VRN1-like [Impatiens glandulifera]|uniref:B3 domain-containing transcription factor VRN1-like n=1 Tax=Impatiens glandulifera TaxID=253017 RepID=UPI001FB0842E|nr:B3 domain-containing transcription factor VRN1-like [Impatiens glandulifera]